jgi:hypothetical protein
MLFRFLISLLKSNKKAGNWGFPAEVKLVRLGCVVGKEKIKLVLIKHNKNMKKKNFYHEIFISNL